MRCNLIEINYSLLSIVLYMCCTGTIDGINRELSQIPKHIWLVCYF